MALIAAPARTGNWLDADEPLSDAVLADVAAAGFIGIYRYVPLPGNSALLDISPGELTRICGTRLSDGTTLQCGLVQHCRIHEYNDLSHHEGEVDAAKAVEHARACGYPEGAHIAVDIEDLSLPSNTPAVVIAYASKWAHQAMAMNAKAQGYFGFDVPLNATELYELPWIDSYWRGLGGPASIATRGFAMLQSGAVRIRGVPFDRNIVKPDAEGSVPVVATLAPTLVA